MFHVPSSCSNKKFCFFILLFILFVLKDTSFFVTIMLITWLEELRRQMEWQDRLANIYADPQPTEPFPLPEAA